MFDRPICPYFKKLNMYTIDCEKGYIKKVKYFIKELDCGKAAEQHHDKYCCEHYARCFKYQQLEIEGRAKDESNVGMSFRDRKGSIVVCQN